MCRVMGGGVERFSCSLRDDLVGLPSAPGVRDEVFRRKVPSDYTLAPVCMDQSLAKQRHQNTGSLLPKKPITKCLWAWVCPNQGNKGSPGRVMAAIKHLHTWPVTITFILLSYMGP
ncbi:hypothetical protein JTE90_016234 [Oedothorax gibbosus]|uniref:Uncharacterized protein n=1 Tax=Oedothorax gibbosus TaxID=931172 RepID=A0AAV6VTH5_9ARAC|nr:hypothetical protein JTE90_016234 [Oedothorax gibbosus]